MEKLLSDFLLNNFNCTDETLLKELIFLIGYVPEDIYKAGFDKGYEEGFSQNTL